MFFMKNNRRFIGMATVNRVEQNVTIKEAWERYGLGKGVTGLNSMIQRTYEIILREWQL
jgi:hypothetical protein